MNSFEILKRVLRTRIEADSIEEVSHHDIDTGLKTVK